MWSCSINTHPSFIAWVNGDVVVMLHLSFSMKLGLLTHLVWEQVNVVSWIIWMIDRAVVTFCSWSNPFAKTMLHTHALCQAATEVYHLIPLCWVGTYYLLQSSKKASGNGLQGVAGDIVCWHLSTSMAPNGSCKNKDLVLISFVLHLTGLWSTENGCKITANINCIYSPFGLHYTALEQHKIVSECTEYNWNLTA